MHRIAYGRECDIICSPNSYTFPNRILVSGHYNNIFYTFELYRPRLFVVGKSMMAPFQSPRNFFFFFRYNLSSVVCVCVYVCMYVFANTATPFNLELSNFGITFLMWISKNGFLKFLKNCFFAEVSPFFYISLRFLCNFEEQLRKNQWR